MVASADDAEQHSGADLRVSASRSPSNFGLRQRQVHFLTVFVAPTEALVGEVAAFTTKRASWAARGTKVTRPPYVSATRLPLFETELRLATLPEMRRKPMIAQAPIFPSLRFNVIK